MIEINLLPQELRKKETALRKFEISNISLRNMPVFKITFAVIGIFIALHLILFLVMAYANLSYASINKKYAQILPQKKEADALKVQYDAINKKVGVIEELMGKRFSWTNKLNALSDCVTPGIWLRDLSYEEKTTQGTTTHPGGTPSAADMKAKKEPAPKGKTANVQKYIVISGYASSMGEQATLLIGRFMKSLKDDEKFYSDFSDIQLGAIRSDKIDQQEVMSFTITCLFKQEQ